MCWQDELEGCGRDKLKLRREVDSLLLEVSRRQSTLSSMAAERGQLQEGGLLVRMWGRDAHATPYVTCH